MFSLMLFTALAALAAGYGVKWYLDYSKSEHEITWNEYAVGAAVIALVLTPLVAVLGWHIAKASLLTYHEYWNGWETAAVREDTVCHKDGACAYHYDCDPYMVYVTELCTDSKGNAYSCGHWETRYHACPYVDMESSFYVKTTLGTYAISTDRFPSNPQAHRWDASEEIPESIIEEAGTGIPDFWQRAKERLLAGKPGPVTVRRDYDNLILASDTTILKQYSDDIAHYRQQQLLPPVASAIIDPYYADKVHFVGWKPQDAPSWQSALDRLNAAFGTELQGDVQIIVVKNGAVSTDPDSYALALKAYWQDKRVFGKDAFSKNGVGVIVGTTDGKSVAWARAFTGMPLGNEHMLVALESSLRGLPLDPTHVIGTVQTVTKAVDDPEAEVSRQVVRTIRSGGIAPILWGDIDPATRFERISMKAQDKTDHGTGFLYLNSEIGPTTGQEIWIAVIIFLLSGGVWFAAAAIGTRTWRRRGNAYSAY